MCFKPVLEENLITAKSIGNWFCGVVLKADLCCYWLRENQCLPVGSHRTRTQEQTDVDTNSIRITVLKPSDPLKTGTADEAVQSGEEAAASVGCQCGAAVCKGEGLKMRGSIRPSAGSPDPQATEEALSEELEGRVAGG